MSGELQRSAVPLAVSASREIWLEKHEGRGSLSLRDGSSEIIAVSLTDEQYAKLRSIYLSKNDQAKESEKAELEIEKKFLFLPEKAPFELSELPAKELYQAYILESDEANARVRRKGEKLLFTLKSKFDDEELEAEFEISEDVFGALNAQRVSSLEKTRATYQLGDYLVEIDCFRGPLAPGILLEVEFPNKAARDAFLAPEWFGIEVTEDPRFKNVNLARAESFPR